MPTDLDKWFKHWRPGSVFKVLDKAPSGMTLAEPGPRAGASELGPGPPAGAAPAGLFRQRAMEGADSLLPGSVIKVLDENEEIPGIEGSSVPVKALPAHRFAELVKKDPTSLLPGSVIRIR